MTADERVERRRLQRRRWADDNPAKDREAKLKWIKNNPEKVRATIRIKASQRRAKRSGADGTLTPAQEAKIRAAATKCYHCGAKLKRGLAQRHLDHIIPLSKGGKHSDTNVVMACPSCNMRKSDGLFNPVTGQGILL